MLMVGGNRNDGTAIFGFDHVKEFCVRYVMNSIYHVDTKNSILMP